MADSKGTVEIQITDGLKLQTLVVRPLVISDVVHAVQEGDKLELRIPVHVVATNLALVLVEKVKRRDGWDDLTGLVKEMTDG